MTSQQRDDQQQHFQPRSVGRRGFLGRGGLTLLAVGGVVGATPDGAQAAPTNEPSNRCGPAHPKPANAGDTRPKTRAVYPPAAFLHNNPGAKIIDVTKVEEALGAPPGTNATPNDSRDDDAAAFNFILDFIKAKEAPYVRDATNQLDSSYVIYVPDGTFHVSQTIAYPGATLQDANGLSFWVHMRIVGQSRERTVIKLKDNTPGFEAGTGKAVIDFPQNTDFDNDSAQTVLRNLTVHTGRNNPGAVGVDFFGANNANIDNVRIVAGDGRGRTGLSLTALASGYYRDITIEGFDYGVEMLPYHFVNPAIEHLTLRGQHLAGVHVGDCTPTLRSVRSDNTVPPFLITGTGAHVVIIDSVLTGGHRNAPAVDLRNSGHLFLRNVTVAGYGLAVRRVNRPNLPGRHIAEYASDPVFTFDPDQRKRSLALPIEEVPATPWPDPSHWANVDDFGAIGDGETDDSAAIQAACDSGAAVVYFPKQAYHLSATVDVPASVQRIAFLFTSVLSDPDLLQFRVAATAHTTLFVDDVHRVAGGTLLDHAAVRTLVVNTVRAGGKLGGELYRNNPTGANGTVFFNNVNGLKAPQGILRNQHVWARWINTESKSTPNFSVADGGVMWVFGYKVEGGTINFDVTTGGTLEVLGGLANQYGQAFFNDGVTPDIVLRSVDGRVSVVASSNGPDLDPSRTDAFDVVIDDTQDGVHHVVKWTELPAREGRGHQWIIPLYVSYQDTCQTTHK